MNHRVDHDDLKKFTLCLSREKGVGYRTYASLVEYYGGVEEIFLTKDHRRFPKISSQLKSAKRFDDPVFGLLSTCEIGYRCIWEEDYPSRLKEISDPPIVIFFKGSWDSSSVENAITIVGSRNITSYGEKWTRVIASSLAAVGYNVVSGMALGVDRMAHISALDAGGKTLAVLATSPHAPSPLANSDVYHRIIDSGGIVMSEAAPDVKVTSGMFAHRNRILAGISLATVVVEAGLKSGSLITANLAFDYDRYVFALPGNVGNCYSEGTNLIIKNGLAKLIQTPEDILVEFGQGYPKNEQKKRVKLEENENLIYNCLLAEPKLIEEIAISVKTDVSKVSAICSRLELKGIICKNEKGEFFIS